MALTGHIRTNTGYKRSPYKSRNVPPLIRHRIYDIDGVARYRIYDFDGVIRYRIYDIDGVERYRFGPFMRTIIIRDF